MVSVPQNSNEKVVLMSVNSAATIPGIISPTLTGFLITEANQTDRFHWQVCVNYLISDKSLRLFYIRLYFISSLESISLGY